jgi:hypothetical protein
MGFCRLRGNYSQHLGTRYVYIWIYIDLRQKNDNTVASSRTTVVQGVLLTHFPVPGAGGAILYCEEKS